MILISVIGPVTLAAVVIAVTSISPRRRDIDEALGFLADETTTRFEFPVLSAFALA